MSVCSNCQEAKRWSKRFASSPRHGMNMLKFRHYLIFAFVAFHAFYVFTRVTPFRPPRIPSPVKGAWESYGMLTGSATSYSFFAPSVASQMIVTNTWTNSGGNIRTEVHDGRHNEGELRLAAMALSLAQLDLTRLSARAMAADVFNRHREAKDVTVGVGVWVVPTMSQYRHGYRPFDQVFYRGTFERRRSADTATEVSNSP
jgi:hypothetical protein